MADVDLDGLDALAGQMRHPFTYADIESIGGGSIYDDGVLVASIRWDTEPVDPRIRRTVYRDEGDRIGEYLVAAANAVPALTARVRELRLSLDIADDNLTRARAEVARLRAELAGRVAEVDSLRLSLDVACDQRDRLRAQVDAVTALCDSAEARGKHDRYPVVATRQVRAALATGAES